jgi:UDP-N-acetylglucosamine--N-acetylmuramyl-(pentapeptide) pyrophosphoryl-undecaprenol N-acetylglucosamine transferase
VYPALSVLQALQQTPRNSGASPDPGLDVLWVGGVGGIEEDLVKRAGVPYEAVSAAGLHGVGLRSLPGNLWQLSRGYGQARQVLRRFRPEVMFFTGGYVAAPVAAAGWRIPSALYVPDIEPALALKFLARFASRIALTTEDSRAYFPGHAGLEVTGYPTRPEMKGWQPAEARRFLGLEADLPTLLVFGGSKGARSINQALLAVVESLLPEMQIVHISGQLDWPEVERLRESRAGSGYIERYHAYPYLHEMGAALSAADLVVSRAGASALGEFPLFGLPAILVPYPYAWRYQKVNADYLARRGAATILADADLPTQLAPQVRQLMGDAARRAAMRQSMQALARPHAAEAIADLLRSLADAKRQGRK